MDEATYGPEKMLWKERQSCLQSSLYYHDHFLPHLINEKESALPGNSPGDA
ncbi:hypothetical protein [Bacillus sp. V3-13]|uniref:hypothetical protein n=1 Tax=Bacillus sp. V3-13 TaxID=2053728 RepID=UPI00215373D6|nr:hypothetical protein [Bacillus sp. V3-13]